MSLEKILLFKRGKADILLIHFCLGGEFACKKISHMTSSLWIGGWKLSCWKWQYEGVKSWFLDISVEWLNLYISNIMCHISWQIRKIPYYLFEHSLVFLQFSTKLNNLYRCLLELFYLKMPYSLYSMPCSLLDIIIFGNCVY